MPLEKATKFKRFSVGAYMKQQRLTSLAVEEKSKKLMAKKRQLNRLDKKIACVVEEIEDRQDMKRQLSKGRTVVSSSFQGSLKKRKVETGSVECSERMKRRRIAETVEAACKIHGGSEKDMEPSTIGLLQTIESKCKEKDIYNAID